MYVPDDLKRINASAIADIDTTCDYCDLPAVEHLPVYNPADSLRGIEGAYAIIHVCNQHLNDGSYLDDLFFCADCGELFVLNHSWDFLAVEIDGEYYCQKCAIDAIDPVPLSRVIQSLHDGDTLGWTRLNRIPDHEILWEGEFSEWSDFPGHTSLQEVARELELAKVDYGYNDSTLVWPLITHTYQFSIVLAVYIAE